MKPFLITEAKHERYTREGYWGLPTLNEIFDQNAARYPDMEIFVDSHTRLTFAQASRYVDRLALGLMEMGFRKDDVLLIQLPNIVEAPLLRLACYKAGLLALPIMAAFDVKEVRHIATWTEAKGIVIPWKIKDKDYVQIVQVVRPDAPHLRHVLMVGDEVPAGCISVAAMMQRPIENDYPGDYLADKGVSTWEIHELQTSTGSTGLPKISEGYGWPQFLGHILRDRWKLTPSDVLGLFVPLPGGIANNSFAPSLLVPCRLALLETFTPRNALELIQREKVTVALTVPAMGEMILRDEDLNQYDLSSLRVWFISGAPMPPSLAKEIEEKLQCTVVSLLGSTDFGHICCSSVDQPAAVRHFSVGKPMQGVEVRIVDEKGQEVPRGQEGELTCRGPHSYTGYYRMPEASLEAYGGNPDGWFRMGDLAKQDADGNLYVIGRLKDVIKRGGMTIAPVEIEDLLRAHPKIEQVAAAPMPDPIMGEKVCAFVIPKPGAQLSFEEMVAFLRDKGLATFKLPERLEIVSEFPLVGGQKIAKMKLTETVTEKLKQEGKI